MAYCSDDLCDDPDCEEDSAQAILECWAEDEAEDEESYAKENLSVQSARSFGNVSMDLGMGRSNK